MLLLLLLLVLKSLVHHRRVVCVLGVELVEVVRMVVVLQVVLLLVGVLVVLAVMVLHLQWKRALRATVLPGSPPHVIRWWPPTATTMKVLAGRREVGHALCAPPPPAESRALLFPRRTAAMRCGHRDCGMYVIIRVFGCQPLM